MQSLLFLVTELGILYYAVIDKICLFIITGQEMTPTTIIITDFRGRVTRSIGGSIGGSIAGVFVVFVVAIGAVFYAVRIWRTRQQHARATSTHVTHSSNDTATSTNNSSSPLSTQPHSPLVLPTTFLNLPQPQPQSAPKLTFTQPSNPSITEAPPPAYHLHETFAIYSENKKPSDDPPPYHPPSYDVATEEAKYRPPNSNTPQD